MPTTELLFNVEAALFGSTTFSRPGEPPEKIRGGQSLRVIPEGDWTTPQVEPSANIELSGIQKYLGYGTVRDEKTEQVYSRLSAGQSVTLKLVPPRKALPAFLDQIHRALWLMSAFGGIGGRNRRGWGSLRVEIEGGSPEGLSDPHEDPSDAFSALEKGLTTIFGSRDALPVSRPEREFTSFSQRFALAVGPARGTWDKALDAAGQPYFEYCKLLGTGGSGPDLKRRREWLKLFPKTSFQGFAADDKCAIASSTSAFGLPRNAYFKDEDQTLKVGVGAELNGRRASPLFISVLGNQESFRPVLLWLPAKFLPEDEAPYGAVDDGEGYKTKYGGDGAVKSFFDGHDDTDWSGLLKSGWSEVWPRSDA